MSTESTGAIEEAASDWLVRRNSGAWTPADERALEEWLNASSLHRVALWRLEVAWEESARLKALGAGVVGDQPPPRGEWNLTPFFESRDQKAGPDGERREGLSSIGDEIGAAGFPAPWESPPKPRRGLRAMALASAASLLLAIGTAAYYWFLEPAGHYSTPVGGIASVPLQDGSHITLNTATDVQVALTGLERDIDLARGEAFFEVAKDSKRPFVVNAGRKRVIAVGTQFSVMRDVDRIRVIVTEGTVRIEDRAAGSARLPVLPLSAAHSVDAVLLSAGSIARAGDAGVLVQKETPSETQEQLSWRSGVLMFRDQTLAEAVAEFNRYNKLQIVIHDPAVAALKIEGNFRATNVEAFVRLLENGFPVHATESDSQVLLSSN